MFREFNVKFEDVEMIGGADNLLEGTDVTKVIVRGDSKMSSLNSAFKNCAELDTIDGQVDLNGVTNIDNMLVDSELVKRLDLKNINYENISANNSFPNIDELTIGGEVYNKSAIQNVVASRDWTFDNISYVDTVGEKADIKSSIINDENKIVIDNSLEQKARGIEIVGQTYENLIIGSGEATLSDELSIDIVEGNPREFNPSIEQPICVDVIEGQTYQNLIEGKGEYKLTDTFNKTWTETDNFIDNPPSAIEIPEIWGNTIQYENDLSNIQSVGELYVDEDGNSILDDEGNEQYKVEIEASDNINILDYELGYDIGLYNDDGIFDASQTRERTGKCYSKVKEGKKYAFYNNNGEAHGQWFKIYAFDGNKRFIKRLSNSYASSIFYYTIPKNQGIKYIKICITDVWDTPHIIEYGKEIKFYGSGKGLSNKTTILMPQPLRKVDSVSDKLYWDNNKKKYIVEKNIDVITPNISEYGNIVRDEFTNNERFTFNVPSSIKYSKAHTSTNDESLVVSNFIVCNYGDYDKVEYRNGICKASNQFKVFFEKGRFVTVEKFKTWFENSNTTFYYSNTSPQIIETKILEKPSLETYSLTTYISTNTEVQPSQMNITNKQTIFKPLGLSSNLEYTIQLDSIGKNDKPITVNLGGTTSTIQPTNDASKHHKVVVRTPATLTNETLELSGEGVVVNDVMLFQGGNNSIEQDVEYIEGIESIGIPTTTKNKLNLHNATFQQGGWTNPNGEPGMGNDWRVEEYIPINLDVSKDHYCTVYSMYTRLYGYDENKKFIGKFFDSGVDNSCVISKNVLTQYSNMKYFRFSCSTYNDNIKFTQLEEGTVGTKYQEYYDGERHKVDILSTNKLTNISYDMIKNAEPINYNDWTAFYFKIKTQATFNINKVMTNCRLLLCNTNEGNIGISDSNSKIFNTNVNTGTWTSDGSDYICVAFHGTNVSSAKGKEIILQTISQNTFSILSNDDTLPKYLERYGNLQSILLPQPLNKIGDIKDRFYWDDNKGHYCIEQNVGAMKCKDYSWWKLDSSIDGIDTFILSNFNNDSYRPTIWGGKIISCDDAIVTLDAVHLRFKYPASKFKSDVELFKEYCLANNIFILLQSNQSNIIDLPHLNKKYSLDTYMPTTYIECTDTPLQPSRMYLETDTVRYKPSALETDTDYTIQFECLEKSDKKLKLNLGGAKKEIDPVIGVNHVSITTPSEINTDLYKDRLFLSGAENKVDNVMVVKGEMNQYPNYFEGLQNSGILQDGKYKIDIKTNEEFSLSIKSVKPIAKNNKLYWSKSNKRYEIDRNGEIEVPIVEGDIIDLPRLYQRKGTTLVVDSGNINPSKIKIEYNDFD